MKYYKSVFISVACALSTFSLVLQAQNVQVNETGLLDVPDYLSSDVKANLNAQKVALEKRAATLQQGVEQWKAKWNNREVPKGSPLAATAQEEEAKLVQEGQNYSRDAVAFDNAVLEATKIGVAAAVRGEVDQMTADNHARVVHTGDSIFSNAHITTSPDGRLQVLLIDETIFTLGPSSDMIMDEFVYDPKTSAGKVSAKISKGTFRFVTGKIASKDPDKMKIKVAVGTIGIRGTDVEVSVEPSGDGYVRLFSGKLEITETKSGEVFNMDAGQMVKFHADGSWDQPTSLGATKPTI